MMGNSKFKMSRQIITRWWLHVFIIYSKIQENTSKLIKIQENTSKLIIAHFDSIFGDGRSLIT